MENIGFSAVYQEAERVYNMKRDYIVPSEKISIYTDPVDKTIRLRFFPDLVWVKSIQRILPA
jgi:hypothetical protein